VQSWACDDDDDDEGQSGSSSFGPPVLGTDDLIVLEPKNRLLIGGTEYATGLAAGEMAREPCKDRRTIRCSSCRACPVDGDAEGDPASFASFELDRRNIVVREDDDDDGGW
jgi:hypothetical protein